MRCTRNRRDCPAFVSTACTTRYVARTCCGSPTGDVRATGGSEGVDGQTFDHIEAYGKERWVDELAEELKRKDYRCSAVRRVWIPKANGKQRPLGIPRIRDRVVQMAAVLILEPIFEADLQPEQYGYRLGKSAHDAIRQVHSLLNTGHTEVIDADLSGYFDNIDHTLLMKAVSAVHLLVECARIMQRSRKICHYEAWILLALRVFRLPNDPSGTAPRLSRTIPKTAETTSRFPCLCVLSTCAVKLLLDALDQARISRQANDIEETLLLAPLQKLISTESAIPTDDDLNVLPSGADHAHDARQLLRHSFGRVDLRRAQLRAQKVVPAEDIQRQITITIVMPVEEPSLLLAMQLVVRHVQIQHDLLGASRVAGEERLHEELLNHLLIGNDLFRPREKPFTGFQPVERALPRAGLSFVPLMSSVLTAGISLAAQGGEKRIVAQHVVIVGVLVAQAQPYYLLAHQLLHTVLDEPLIAEVGETVRKLTKRVGGEGEFTKQQSSSVRTDHPAVEACNYFPLAEVLKAEKVCGAVCLHGEAFLFWLCCLFQSNYTRAKGFLI